MNADDPKPLSYAAPESQRPRFAIYWAGWVAIGLVAAGLVLAVRDWLRF